MQYAGLIIEVLLLGLGIYLYLFAIGGLKFKNPQYAARAEQFRKDNAGWLRIAALAMMAIMFFNVFLSVKALLG